MSGSLHGSERLFPSVDPFLPPVVDLAKVGVSRRGFLSTLAGCGFLAVGGAGCSPLQRRLLVRHSFRWDPIGIVTELAIHVVRGNLDYIDARCEKCGTAIRIILPIAEVIPIIFNRCPGCTVGIRLLAGSIKALLAKLASHGVITAVGWATGDGYEVFEEAPVRTKFGELQVARSAVCYTIHQREPDGLFSRDIPAIPDRICFFTDVRGMTKPTKIYHVWRRDGIRMDRISLDICYGQCGWRFRTWSHKHNLGLGTWIVTAETRSGEILATREFYIGGG